MRNQMPFERPLNRSAIQRTVMSPGIILAFALFWLDCGSAHAQPKLTAHYVLSLAAITIGGGDWKVEIG